MRNNKENKNYAVVCYSTFMAPKTTLLPSREEAKRFLYEDWLKYAMNLGNTEGVDCSNSQHYEDTARVDFVDGEFIEWKITEAEEAEASELSIKRMSYTDFYAELEKHIGEHLVFIHELNGDIMRTLPVLIDGKSGFAAPREDDLTCDTVIGVEIIKR